MLAVSAWWKMRNVEGAIVALQRGEAKCKSRAITTETQQAQATNAPDVKPDSTGVCRFVDHGGDRATTTCDNHLFDRQRMCCCTASGEDASAMCPVMGRDCVGDTTWDKTSGVCWPTSYSTDVSKAFVNHGSIAQEDASASEASSGEATSTTMWILGAVGSVAVVAVVLAAVLGTVAVVAVTMQKRKVVAQQLSQPAHIEIASIVGGKRKVQGPVKPPKPQPKHSITTLIANIERVKTRGSMAPLEERTSTC